MGMGKQLGELLKDIDMNVNELAGKIEVRPQRIYNIIARDTKKVDKELVLKISKALGVPTDYFYSDNSLNSYLRTGDRILDSISVSGREAKSINKEEYSRKVNEELRARRNSFDGGSRILLNRFRELNKDGKKELLKRASELARLEEYTKKLNDTKSDMSNSE